MFFLVQSSINQILKNNKILSSTRLKNVLSGGARYCVLSCAHTYSRACPGKIPVAQKKADHTGNEQEEYSSPNHSLLLHSITLMSFTGTFPFSSKLGHELQSNGWLETDIYSKRCLDLLTDHLRISVMMMQSVEFMSL